MVVLPSRFSINLTGLAFSILQLETGQPTTMRSMHFHDTRLLVSVLYSEGGERPFVFVSSLVEKEVSGADDEESTEVSEF